MAQYDSAPFACSARGRVEAAGKGQFPEWTDRSLPAGNDILLVTGEPAEPLWWRRQ